MKIRFALTAILALGCGTSGEGPRDAAPEASPPRPAKGGAIFVESSVYSIQEKLYPKTSVFGRFTDERVPACTMTTTQGCTTTICPDGATPTPLSPGSITVDGMPGGPVTVSVPGSYLSSTQDFVGGELLHASTSGDVIPAFTRSATAPSFLTVTAPSWPPAGTLVVPRGQDLTVKWDGGTLGVAFVTLSDGKGEVRCEAPATRGSIVVPHALFAPLANAASIRIGAVSRDLGVAGDYAADFIVTAIASRGGAIADGPVSIE